MQYGNRTTEEPDEDGKIKRTVEGWYNGQLNTIKIETREDTVTSQQTLLADVVKCLDLLKTDTPEITIVIKKDKFGYPSRLSKTWVISKKKNN